MQRQHAFEIDTKRVPDTRNLERGLRIIAVFSRPDDAITGSRGKSQLGEIRCETDDPDSRWRNCRLRCNRTCATQSQDY
jgi:hypothetical protein